MDDETGWDDVLTSGWHAGVRDAVVSRVEHGARGRHGLLVRTLSDPDVARYAWVEDLHQRVLVAIRDETGADLDELGSQAAWACYEDVWERLRRRWERGGRLARVPLGSESEVVHLVQSLPVGAAEAAGADVSTQPPDPLWLRGRLLVDVTGLRLHLDGPGAGDDDLRILVGLIIGACGRGP